MIKNIFLSSKIFIYIIQNNASTLVVMSKRGKTSFLITSNYIFLSDNFNILTIFVFRPKLTTLKLNRFLFAWNSFFVRKIKFRHKIMWFRIFRKYHQAIKFNLGLSHFNYVFFDSVRFFRKKKYLTYHNFVLWSNSYFNLNNLTIFIKNLQPISPYTQKGFRFSRDIYQKRAGKASKYAHLKSKLF